MSEEIVEGYNPDVLRKDDTQRFVFADGGYQDFPNITHDKTAAIVDLSVDISTVKYENGEMVPLTQEDLQARIAADFQKAAEDYEKRIDAMMDDKAREYGYSTIKTAVTYAEEPAVPSFQAEGQAFRRWRSLVYAKSYEILAEAQQTMTVPTYESVLSQLPAFELDQA